MAICRTIKQIRALHLILSYATHPCEYRSAAGYPLCYQLNRTHKYGMFRCVAFPILPNRSPKTSSTSRSFAVEVTGSHRPTEGLSCIGLPLPELCSSVQSYPSPSRPHFPAPQPPFRAVPACQYALLPLATMTGAIKRLLHFLYSQVRFPCDSSCGHPSITHCFGDNLPAVGFDTFNGVLHDGRCGGNSLPLRLSLISPDGPRPFKISGWNCHNAFLFNNDSRARRSQSDTVRRSDAALNWIWCAISGMTRMIIVSDLIDFFMRPTLTDRTRMSSFVLLFLLTFLFAHANIP